ncbi:NADP-dependent alcohol dehydrogenase C 1 [Sulfurospirillum diekertiae]|uniref:NADP-dependent alcohol dehydrogenase C 1 n=1 Tax=Sulfurospirillum diekertiae TaxID=1854492 RepID=A0A290HU96_9BACT|nr:NAD(P)-dependent alcohol dehydrogenase [Sulfurospirillum diekertiae]ATB70204.1 NADP-dependent alcohol dehydrogenase C 1 [Sulfurospirillum diekertiae]
MKKQSNETDHVQDTLESNTTHDSNRRNFMLTGAIALGTGATGLLNPLSAQAAETNPTNKVGDQGPYPTMGMAVYSATEPLKPLHFQRRALGPKDVAMKLHYCGVCHSDIHHGHEDWRKEKFPLVPGHELAGVVTAIGSSVSKFKVGDRVGVGCMVNSCHHCEMCDMGMEQYCENGAVFTYGSTDRDGTMTQGGYSTFNVVNEDFIIHVPAAVDLADAGPMMCAGITVYSPFRHWSVGPGKKVGVVGLGGLGHMAVKIATAMGAEVTVITTSPDKVADAKNFGAKEVIVNPDSTDLSKFDRSLDFIIDTAPYKHKLDKLFTLLKQDSTYCMVGVGKVNDPYEIGPFSLLRTRTSYASSQIGGIRETQELVDFCALHNIKPQITKIAMSEITDAWEKVVAKKARYRYVIDMQA